jgi:hypothetical protein
MLVFPRRLLITQPPGLRLPTPRTESRPRRRRRRRQEPRPTHHRSKPLMVVLLHADGAAPAAGSAGPGAPPLARPRDRRPHGFRMHWGPPTAAPAPVLSGPPPGPSGPRLRPSMPAGPGNHHCHPPSSRRHRCDDSPQGSTPHRRPSRKGLGGLGCPRWGSFGVAAAKEDVCVVLRTRAGHGRRTERHARTRAGMEWRDVRAGCLPACCWSGKPRRPLCLSMCVRWDGLDRASGYYLLWPPAAAGTIIILRVIFDFDRPPREPTTPHIPFWGPDKLNEIFVLNTLPGADAIPEATTPPLCFPSLTLRRLRAPGPVPSCQAKGHLMESKTRCVCTHTHTHWWGERRPTDRPDGSAPRRDQSSTASSIYTVTRHAIGGFASR